MSTSAGASRVLLSARAVSRRFGVTTAVRNVDLDLRAGDRVALLGPNGAGKTTLMRMLALGLGPTSGTISVMDQKAPRQGGEARRHVGFISHRTGLYDDLTPRENLRLYGRLYGTGDLDDRIAAVLEEVSLSHVAGAPVRSLSRGMQQRVGLARAILHEPEVLLMDEPDTGLDPQAQDWLVDLIRRWADMGRTVCVATHRLEWAERFVSRALVLERGAVAAQLDAGSPGSLAASYASAVRLSE